MKISYRLLFIIGIYFAIISVVNSHGYHANKVKPKMEPTYLYKIFTKSQWENIDNRAFDFTMGSDLDLKSQYLHLSTAHQVEYVAKKFHPKLSDGYLVKIDYAKVKDNITWERKASGEVFPHLYDLVPRNAILEAIVFDTAKFKYPRLEY